jgi:hypothetical protein
MDNTLEVYLGEELIFRSDGKWLYPLFELEDFLAGADLEAGQLTVKDKIVGRAAALLEIRLGVGRIEAGIMLVERILCKTEELLVDEYDPERAHEILKARAGH